jgi:hypothetical protein
MSNETQSGSTWWQTLVGLLEMAGRGASTPPFGVPGDTW